MKFIILLSSILLAVSAQADSRKPKDEYFARPWMSGQIPSDGKHVCVWYRDGQWMGAVDSSHCENQGRYKWNWGIKACLSWDRFVTDPSNCSEVSFLRSKRFNNACVAFDTNGKSAFVDESYCSRK